MGPNEPHKWSQTYNSHSSFVLYNISIHTYPGECRQVLGTQISVWSSETSEARLHPASLSASSRPVSRASPSPVCRPTLKTQRKSKHSGSPVTILYSHDIKNIYFKSTALQQIGKKLTPTKVILAIKLVLKHETNHHSSQTWACVWWGASEWGSSRKNTIRAVF